MRPRRKQKEGRGCERWRCSGQRFSTVDYTGAEPAAEHEMLTFEVCRDVGVSREREQTLDEAGPKTSLQLLRDDARLR